MKKKLWLKLLLVLLVLAAAVLLFAGNYLVDYAIVRQKNVEKDVAPPSEVSDADAGVIAENLAWIRAQKEEWLAGTTAEEVSVTSEDGLALKGDLFAGKEDSHRWLLAVHGYTGQRSDMQNIASFYGVQGYHVLTPDMRSHGESEGTYIGMGWLDRLDVLLWIDFITARDPQAEIILHGVSMGGATVMMVSSEELPENVKGIVEDCGYTSVWDIFADELAYLFHLPAFPVLDAANLMSNIRAGYDFKKASAVKQVAKSRVPMVFIHGSEDNFVHTEMVYEVYEACQTPKELLVVEGAGHGQAYQMDPELYFTTVFDFLESECFS